MANNLSPQQEKFCLEYMKSGIAAEACMKAGFKCTTRKAQRTIGSRLLRNPKIIERINELKEEMKRETIADVVECQQKLTDIIRNDGIKAFSRIKAIEILLRTHGAFETNINVTSAIPIVISGGDMLE